MCGAGYAAIFAVVEHSEEALRGGNASDYMARIRLIDLTAFVAFIAVIVATGIALMVGSAKVHHTKRVAVCMAILLLLGGCIVGLCYFLVSLLAWLGR